MNKTKDSQPCGGCPLMCGGNFQSVCIFSKSTPFSAFLNSLPVTIAIGEVYEENIKPLYSWDVLLLGFDWFVGVGLVPQGNDLRLALANVLGIAPLTAEVGIDVPNKFVRLYPNN